MVCDAAFWISSYMHGSSTLCISYFSLCLFRAVLLSLPGFVGLGALACFLGLVVYAYFAQVGCDPLEIKAISNPNQVSMSLKASDGTWLLLTWIIIRNLSVMFLNFQLVPLFVSDVLDFLPGFLGLFIASLFCASLRWATCSLAS